MGAAGMSTGGTTIAIPRGVEYRCGDCGARNMIKAGDPVRCRQCGFRILYKMRTKRCKFTIRLSIRTVSKEQFIFPVVVFWTSLDLD